MSSDFTMTIGVDSLTAAIEAVTARVPGRDLARAADALSSRYRDAAAAEGRSAGLTSGNARHAARIREDAGARGDDASGEAAVSRPLTDAERAAYLAVRAPATLAAVDAVLDELADRCPDLDVRSILDLGAGPGVGVWAALARYPRASRITLVERDRGFVAIGREILDASDLSTGRIIDWQTRDIADLAERTDRAHRADRPEGADRAEGAKGDRHTLPRSDLVLLSYALGELSVADRTRAIDAAWAATLGALVIVEPGTPRHFGVVIDARTHLLAGGATMAAPCPHTAACPMAAAGDWCHVSVRLARSKLHRRLKAGSLSYEDEKFSYLVVSRTPTQPAASRIVRHPIFEKGRVTLTRCTAEGLVTDTIGRTSREAYRQARKARWGDAWPRDDDTREEQPREEDTGEA